MAAQTSSLDKSAARALEKLQHIGVDSILDASVQPRQVPQGRNKANKIRVDEPDAPILPLETYSAAFLILLGKLMRHAPSLEQAKTVLLKHVERRRDDASLSDRVRFVREVLIGDLENAVEEMKAASGKAQGKRRAESPLEEPPRQAPARKKVRFSLTGEDGEQLVLPSDPLDDVANASGSAAVDDSVPTAQRRKSAALATKLLVDCLNALPPYPPEMAMTQYEIIRAITLGIGDVGDSTSNLEGMARCEDLLAALSTVNKLEEKTVNAFAEWEERHVASRAKSIFQVLQRDNGLVLADDLKARFQSRAF
ncbi:uncharacterized protein J3D65DRAFT_671990 [Phyllosticta citribraziliensis]|uniref:Uncharacterized protein n=1 Tax=Phyllosticta citribraziliensis TaxID=989973 RepID=A0ABR1L957_9PEZI